MPWCIALPKQHRQPLQCLEGLRQAQIGCGARGLTAAQLLIPEPGFEYWHFSNE